MISYKAFSKVIEEDVLKEIARSADFKSIICEDDQEGNFRIEMKFGYTFRTSIREMYELYKEIGYLDIALKEIIAGIRKLMDEKREAYMRVINDFNYANFNLVLMNSNRNKEFLKSVPHIISDDIAVVVVYCNNDAIYKNNATVITYELMDRISESHNCYFMDLLEIAKKNEPNVKITELRVCCTSSYNKLFYILDVSAKKGFYGATAMFNKKILDELSDYFKDDLIIFPYSPHNFRVIAKSEFEGLCAAGCKTSLIESFYKQQKKLSDFIYLYEKSNKKMSKIVQ